MDREECRRLIAGDSYVDILIRYRDDPRQVAARYPEGCVQIVNENWIVVYGREDEMTPLNYGSYGYFSIPKLYGLMDNSNMVESGIVRVLNQPNLALTGEGVIIGFVDTGIDYLHEAFRNQYGRSRILSIWDQTDNSGILPEGIDYGSVYTTELINEAIDSNTPYDIVPQRDDSGHGTFVAGIAAGSTRGNDFTGAAPGCDIVMVKLRQAKPALRDFFLVNTDATAYSETDIMLGVRYLLDIAARENKPLVICLGVGTSYGPHTVGAPLAQLLLSTADLVRTTVVVPVGNEGNARHHFLGEVEGNNDFETVELRVGDNERGFILELWGRFPDILSVGIVSPTGEVIERIPAQSQVSRRETFIFDNTIIYIDYKLVETINASQLIAMRFVGPSAGLWQIRVYGDNVLSEFFDMWLPITEFVSTQTYFVQSNPYITLTQPSTAYTPISVAAYNHGDGSAWIDSGRGYTANGAIKPDLAAPGVNIYGPRAGTTQGYTIRSGTSIAAAHVAGASALLFEWYLKRNRNTVVNTLDIKSLLIVGARRNNNQIYPNPSTGYGFLDIYGVFENLAT